MIGGDSKIIYLLNKRGGPAPRRDHVATATFDLWLLYFGLDKQVLLIMDIGVIFC